MENILSLAFFYSTKRPWNQYYASPAVRLRLEAALDFWCRMQHSDGRFSEYSPQRWNLPATAFATKFIGEALALLHGGPPIDAKLYERVVKANRRAIRIVMTDPALLQRSAMFLAMNLRDCVPLLRESFCSLSSINTTFLGDNGNGSNLVILP